ncbi:MAG: hypothetical protein ACOYZ7_09080 [Chloroflexota bacterium]
MTPKADGLAGWLRRRGAASLVRSLSGLRQFVDWFQCNREMSEPR